MNSTLLRLMLRCATATAVITSLSWLLLDLSAPDACLDSGGAFDHLRRICSFDNSERLATVNVPMTALTSFQVFLGCTVVFLAVLIALPPHRHDPCPIQVNAIIRKRASHRTQQRPIP